MGKRRELLDKLKERGELNDLVKANIISISVKGWYDVANMFSENSKKLKPEQAKYKTASDANCSYSYVKKSINEMKK